MRNYFLCLVLAVVFAVFQSSAVKAVASSLSINVEQTLSFDRNWRIWDLFTFVPVVADGARYKAWEFSIYDSDGRKIKRIKSENSMPQSIQWGGTDTAGRLLPDGFYEAKLRAWDYSGRVTESPVERFIFMLPPEFQDVRDKEITIRAIPPDLVLELPGLLFEEGSILPKHDTGQVIKAVAGLLEAYSENPVEIDGYTDNTGSYSVNLAISEKRAMMVYEGLVSSGIKPERLKIRALADKNPIASNLTKEGRARNRRVEVVILAA